MMHLASHPIPHICFPDNVPTVHGFTTTASGDMRDIGRQEAVFRALGYTVSDRIWPEQTHGADIAIVTAQERGTIVHAVDGLLYQYRDGDPPVFLTVHTADCLPILCIDRETKSIGSAHAGWKGTVLHIASAMVETMVSLGAKTSTIRVLLGPGICDACYSISEERASVCRQAFPDGEVVRMHQGKWVFDIRQAVYQDLVKEGIIPEHITFDQSLCTYEQQDMLYSYRRDGAPLRGEMMGFISLQNMTGEAGT